jgi:serine protease Do
VIKGGPADKAGIKEGDVIIELGGKPVEDAGQLRNKVSQTKPGTKLKIKIIRNGKEQSLTATIEELPETVAAAPGSALAGLEVANIDANARRERHIPRGVSGVVITQVAPGSPAQQAGLRAGDIIQELDRQPVKNISDYQKLSAAIDKDSEVLLLVNRRGRRGYLVVRPA